MGKISFGNTLIYDDTNIIELSGFPDAGSEGLIIESPENKKENTLTMMVPSNTVSTQVAAL